MSVDQPVAEGAASTLWCVAYRANDGYDVLSYRYDRVGGGVVPKQCLFAARWRDGEWRSTVGELDRTKMAAVTAWAKRLP